MSKNIISYVIWNKDEYAYEILLYLYVRFISTIDRPMLIIGRTTGPVSFFHVSPKNIGNIKIDR